MRRERREWRNYHLATLKQHASQDHQVLTDEDPGMHDVLLPAYDQPGLADWQAIGSLFLIDQVFRLRGQDHPAPGKALSAPVKYHRVTHVQDAGVPLPVRV